MKYSKISFYTPYPSSFAGVLSALGLALADVVHEMQEPSGKVLNSSTWPIIHERFEYLSNYGIDQLTKQGYEK